MLNPASSRCDYGHLLRPPPPDETGGVAYELDAAIATTYSLDLNALLVLPVSLVLGNTLEGDLAGEKIALLDAISQLGGKLKVFYQRGVQSALRSTGAHARSNRADRSGQRAQRGIFVVSS
jgi:hypothetical protein